MRRNDNCRNWEDVVKVETPGYNPNQLEIISPFNDLYERYIYGQELVKRSIDLKANLGESSAAHLLTIQKEIPEKWKDFYFVFTGAIKKDKEGVVRVLCLAYYREKKRHQKGWYLYWRMLEEVFFCNNCRLLRPGQ